MHDLLLHVDSDDASLTTALRNALNYHNAGVQEPYRVVLVVNGKAVALFKRETCTHAAEIATLLQKNTTICLCNNALREMHIDPAELLPGLVVVPAGIVELVKLQHEGFAYVKP